MKVDENTAKRYKVVEETIDLEILRREKEGLEQTLAMPEPTTEELIELGKGMHPYYQNKDWIKKRIEEIDSLLK